MAFLLFAFLRETKTRYMKYILIACLLLACNRKTKTDEIAISAPRPPLDTITQRPAHLSAKPLLFEGAFIKGSTDMQRKVKLTFFGITIGNIKIPSGKIIACDPMNIDEYGIAFTQSFPTGEFPVEVAVATMVDAEEIAFARIKFSEAPVERWEFALKPGEEALPIWGKKMRGYSTDSGTGVYLDETANKPLERDEVTDMDRGIYTEMEKNARGGWRFAMYKYGQHNLAAHTTGFGDGFFATYIGYDAQGRPCRLLTDFGLVDWNK